MSHKPASRRTAQPVALVLFLLFCGGLLLPQMAVAQVLYGSLTGTVTDPTGAAIPNAAVEVVNTGTALAKRINTDERGAFLLSDLPPGTYNLTVSAPSFSKHISRASRSSSTRCGA